MLVFVLCLASLLLLLKSRGKLCFKDKNTDSLGLELSDAKPIALREERTLSLGEGPTSLGQEDVVVV